ncbi:MAG TPA: UbiA family prenyltransferase [Candidatus Moranbacteria bacterium]|nr:UbiA family prenyltransferase [Candidatus Moranbacteria bacterium]
MWKIEKIFENILETKISLLAWAGIFSSIIMLRVFTEQFVARSAKISEYQLIIEYIHNFYFFIITFIIIWLYLSLFLKLNPQKLAYLLIWASLLILPPPFLDMAKTKGELFWSFYIISGAGDLKNQFLTIFGNLPSGIVYFGTRITFLLAIAMCAGAVYLKTKNWIKTVVSSAVVYIILFFMGSFPSIFFFAYNSVFGTKNFFEIKSFEIAQFFGAPQKILGIDSLTFRHAFAYKVELFYFPILILLLLFLFYLINSKKFFSMIANLRYPQLVYHGGLFFLGIGLGFLNFRENLAINIFSIEAVFVLLTSVFLAWIASVVFNDIYDLEIDKISNPDRPLPKGMFEISEYAQLGAVLFLLSLLGGVTIGFNFFMLLLTYQIIAWFYSSLPFRLKKFPVAATLVSSLASLMVLFLGYILISPDQTVYTLNWRIILLLIVCYTISIPIKDFKDIEGDKKYGIWTIPVIFGKKNARLIVAICHFCSYILSVFLLNERRLFLWALIFGAINYTIVISKKINPRKVFWWVLGTVSVYLLIMIKIIFVDNLGKFNF